MVIIRLVKPMMNCKINMNSIIIMCQKFWQSREGIIRERKKIELKSLMIFRSGIVVSGSRFTFVRRPRIWELPR